MSSTGIVIMVGLVITFLVILFNAPEKPAICLKWDWNNVPRGKAAHCVEWVTSVPERCNRECDKVLPGKARADCYLGCTPKIK